MSRLIQKIKILIIDDDKNLCENLCKIFTYEGYIAKFVTDGLKAVKMIRNENYHLAILDLKMPKVDGIEILNRIRKVDKNIGVIVLTGFPSVDSAVATLKNQANDYITKPFNNDDLVMVVKETIKKLGLIEDPFIRMNKQIGRDVKSHRMHRNFTIRELAEKTGLSVGLISQIENGKNAASILTLYKIAHILDVKLYKFLENV